MSGKKADCGDASPGDAGHQVRQALTGAAVALLALALWTHRVAISSWFADSYTTRIGLMTTNERDDARVQRVFAAVQSAQASGATIEHEPGFHPFRDVQVPGSSSAESVAAAEALSKAIVTAFDAEGPGVLNISLARRAHAVPGPTTNAIENAFAYGAPLLALAGIALLWIGWHAWPAGATVSGMPRAPFFGAIGIAVMGVLPFLMPGWLFMALFAMIIPGTIAGTAVYKLQQVRRAAYWPSAQGRIVRSRMRAVRHQHAGEATKVGNVPDVEYAYSVGGVEYRGHRIGIGDIPAGSAEGDAALERYKVGRTGPVFYNPDRPEEAVLERDPPARPLVIYGVAAGVMLVGLAVVVAFTRAREIVAWLEPHFSPGAVVVGFLFCMAAGILLLLFHVADRRSARAATRWPTTTGTILSSVAEPHRQLVPGGRGQTVIVWSPVVEYSYRVEGRDYHGTRLAFGDPANPALAVLEARVAHAWLTLLLMVAFFTAALFFSGWRGFIP
jgi:hypothetical protein